MKRARTGGPQAVRRGLRTRSGLGRVGMYGKRVRKNDQAVGGWVGKRQKVRGRKK